MTFQFMPLAVLAFVSLAVVRLTASANAQTPPPMKEAELVAAGYKKLTGPELSAMVTGNTLYVVFLAPVGGARAGAQATMFYRDAKTRISIPGGGPEAGKRIEGNWWVEGNSICSEQRVVVRGHSCSVWYQGPSLTYACNLPGNDCNFLVRITPGNPEKM